MGSHTLREPGDENADLRLPNALAANERLRQKLTAALGENVKLHAELAERQAVTISLPDPQNDPIIARLEQARDHGSWLLRRWARQMLGEI